MTNQTQQPQDEEKLVDAYNRMLERVKNAIMDAEKATAPAVIHAIDVAKEKAVEVGEISREEAEHLGEYLRRDLHDAAEYLSETGEELGAWLRFDIQLIEKRLAEAFEQMVDHTQLELDRLRAQAQRASEWHTGEVTGPGTLVCTACGEKLHFHKTGHIPPCPKCRATVYKREAHS